MSRGESFSRFTAGIQSALEVDLGPVQDEPCAVDPCPDGAVYRVPWPAVGGDVAYCPYHLARYRVEHPDLWSAVQEAVDEDLTKFATRGDRFLTLGAIPETLFDESFRSVALLATGYALYEEREPETTVEYRKVDRRLVNRDSHELQRGTAGEFLVDVENEIGVHEWVPDVEATLYGGDSH